MTITFPAISRRQWRAILLVVAMTTFVRIMLQPFIPEGQNQLEPSVIVDAGLLIPVFIIYAFITYIIFSYAFVMLEARLPWSRMTKGVAFGALLGVIWVAYLFEPVPLGEGTPFVEMLGYPIADGLSMLLLGALLGRFVATGPVTGEQRSSRNLLVLLLVPAAMIAVRLFEYNVIDIYSSYADRTALTMIWIVVTGLLIALTYTLLRPGVPADTPLGRSVAFGVFIYGIPITLVNFFMVVALKVNVADLALRSVLDIVAVVVGVYLSEYLVRRAIMEQ